jgi:glucose/arabinose dehydrogenase
MNRFVLFTIAVLALAGVASGEVRLEQVATGLAAPVFVTHAGDGSNRLYVLERAGVVRVIAAGDSVGTVFLDVRNRVNASGNEQGLLGIAFHPAYADNGRFFICYTRRGDGAIVVSEFRRGDDPLTAAPAEEVVIVVPHPSFTNHNGGMLAFGPDGYLYIGTGDGGSSNDPTNQAQSLESLLGKILRIDVDVPDAALGTRYSAPPDNPFVGAAGRDEIFAYGFRNPWRFSFDRVTGALWLADVGQGAREEVDAAIVRGGNYGWRVYEGSVCSGNDPTLCDPTTFIAPTFDYQHTGGRCSITGGYVYRGHEGTVVPGTYVYGDFCTGEIFVWDGTTQAPLLRLSGSLSSFGEDALGELYVVDIAGTIYRIGGTATSTAIEYFHAGFGHYFTTPLSSEIAALDAGTIAGWTRTGQSFRVDTVGAPRTTSMCRFFSTSFAPKSSHFYTPFANECELVKESPDWIFEGEVFAVTSALANGMCPSGLFPLYRLYNDGKGSAPNHRYTTNVDVRLAMLQQGWIVEGFGPAGVFACVPA